MHQARQHHAAATWLMVALVAATACLTVAGAALPGAATAQGGPIYWGAFVHGWPSDSGALDAFEAHAGKHAAIIQWGEPWYHNGSTQAFQTSFFQTVRRRGSIPLLNWGSWDYSNGPKQPAFSLASIAGGTYDAFIAQWARSAKAWGHPFFLRFDHEMNGDWQFPWAEQLNGNHPGDYVRAWRHVHDIFVQQGATNVTWVWCPNVVDTRTTPLSELYPGDAYVDWTCLDGYNSDTPQGTPSRWLSFGQVFAGSALNGQHNSYAEITHLAPHKPLMIGETSSAERGGSKAEWISDALLKQLPENFPLVQALVWFNWDLGGANQQWPIESSPAAQAAFAAGIGSAYYVDNRFRGFDTSPIPPASTVPPPAPSPPAPSPPAPSQPAPSQPAPAPAPAPASAPQAAVDRYFSETHFRIDDDAIWSYFQSRGGVDVFGFPVSRRFTFLGCTSQIFQRQVAQVCSDGQPRLLNLLDPEIFPYTQINGSTLPAVDEAFKAAAPPVSDPTYGSDIIDFVRGAVPDDFGGEPVNFQQTFFGLIGAQTTADPSLVPLIDLEVWGAPISGPTADPNNANFIYQRFQRGIMHYDAATGVTRGLLLADYLKSVITGRDLPDDLREQAQDGPLYQQYCPSEAHALCRPGDLPGTDLTQAFEPE